MASNLVDIEKDNEMRNILIYLPTLYLWSRIIINDIILFM